MDLFVVNRYQGDTEISQNDEKSKLDKLFQKIENNKKRRRKKEDYEAKSKIIAKTTLKRQIKREIKSQIVKIPENDLHEFVEKPSSDEDEPKRKTRKKDALPDSIDGFTVLGAEDTIKKDKVKRVLPRWLSEPTVISTDLTNLNVKTSHLKCLDKDLRSKLKASGLKHFFPVQAEVIPWLIETNKHSTVVFPQDLCVSAPTGSGKTLAFTLPIIQALKERVCKKIRALILLPTQDLALQVFKTFKIYCENTGVDVCFMTGKNPFGIEQKTLISENCAFGYLSKADIVVCTAGRLVDHLENTKGFDLSHLEFLVIDEADRVLENVQHDWLYHLENIAGRASTAQFVNLYNMKRRKSPRKLLFSATLSQDPEKLQKLSLFQPKLFTSIVGEHESATENLQNGFIGKFTTPKELSEKYIVCDPDTKPLVLYKFIEMEKLEKVLIFTNSINETHRLCILLRKLFENKRIEEISSENRKKEIITDYSKGNINMIVCTDALARGIDLPGVQCVVSYSAPKHLRTYIHRAGRTARAGALGTAITLLQTTQVTPFKNLLKQADKTNVTEVEVPTAELDCVAKKYETALEELKKIVMQEKRDDLNRIKRTKRKPH